MLYWFTALITGKLRHWNRNYVTYVDSLDPLLDINPPHIARLLRLFSASSYWVIENLVGPIKDRLLDKEIGDISDEQFSTLHDFILWVFIALFARQNESVGELFIQQSTGTLGMSETAEEVVELILDLESIDLAQIGPMIASSINAILKIDDSTIESILIPVLIGGAYVSAMESFQENPCFPDDASLIDPE